MNDLISRQAAIDALKRDEAYDEDIPNRADGVRDAIITIMGLPSAQPEQRWIPCSERLPESEVLCCDMHGEYMIGYVYRTEESDTGFEAESDECVMYDCVAWMPLPEPYKG